MPKRVQMSRQRPWRAENPDAVIVDRTTVWGNPYVVGENAHDRADAVRRFHLSIIGSLPLVERIRRELGGRDLACWCPLDGPCHADVLLHIANPEGDQ